MSGVKIVQIRDCFNSLYVLVQYEYQGKPFWRTRRADRFEVIQYRQDHVRG